MNKTQDKIEKKNSPHFNALDAVIILLVILILGGMFFRNNIVDYLKDLQNKQEYVISYSVKNIRSTTYDYLSVGDVLYVAESGDKLGVLMTAEDDKQDLGTTSPGFEYFTTSTGELVKVGYPESESRIDFKGRFVCEGVYADNGGFMFGGDTYIAPGLTIQVCTERVTFVIDITSVELYEK